MMFVQRIPNMEKKDQRRKFNLVLLLLFLLIHQNISERTQTERPTGQPISPISAEAECNRKTQTKKDRNKEPKQQNNKETKKQADKETNQQKRPVLFCLVDTRFCPDGKLAWEILREIIARGPVWTKTSPAGDVEFRAC